jgi:hypothetical protein
VEGVSVAGGFRVFLLFSSLGGFYGCLQKAESGETKDEKLAMV